MRRAICSAKIIFGYRKPLIGSAGAPFLFCFAHMSLFTHQAMVGSNFVTSSWPFIVCIQVLIWQDSYLSGCGWSHKSAKNGVLQSTDLFVDFSISALSTQLALESACSSNRHQLFLCMQHNLLTTRYSKCRIPSSYNDKCEIETHDIHVHSTIPS